MNATERRLTGRMYMCLSSLTGLQPPNAANIAAMSENLRVATRVAACLMSALEHIGYQEYEMAGEYLGDAERLLEQKPKAPAR